MSLRGRSPHPSPEEREASPRTEDRGTGSAAVGAGFRPTGPGAGGRVPPAAPGTVGSCAVEELDRQIVELLVADGRMSYTDLGKATGLSTSAVHQRVRRLEQRGVIRGYAAIVDPEAVGLPLTAFISVKPFDPSAPDDIAERLAEVPEIEACHSVAGDENYILKVRVATPLQLENLLSRLRSLAGVSTRTTVVLSTPYESRPPRI